MSTPWPTTPTPVAWHLGKSLALVWIDEHGQRWVAHRFGEPVVGAARRERAVGVSIDDFTPTARALDSLVCGLWRVDARHHAPPFGSRSASMASAIS
jgi:hypothetical protein